MDLLLQSGTYIGAEPNNGVLPNEVKGPNLTPTLAGTTLEMQKTALAAEMAMLVHQVNVGSLKQKSAMLIGHLRLRKAKNRRVARKQRRLLLSTSTLHIRQRV
ncbi:hypothetical protein R3W88_030133 [Solanum pinnatisectum]|uniref:Uncharacterized protein n=1 Tax=Solanum pinnatisectum TaxID=50273 RepID=A0AAV9K7A2_9SOLN|nr:hypothetical protein R3W88_030133 [Solanum pinnatisectum]